MQFYYFDILIHFPNLTEVVPGIIGTLEALEAIKIALGMPCLDDPSFLIFSGMSNPMFRTMKLRSKKKDCAICGEHPTMTELIDYVQFCNGAANDKTVDEEILQANERISVQVSYFFCLFL